MAKQVIRLHVKSKSTLPGKLLNFIRRNRKIKTLKKKLAIDVSLSFLEGANYANLLSKVNEKTIISVRGSKIHDQNISGFFGKVRLKYLIPRLYKRADLIITLSKGLKTELADHFKIAPDIIKVIPNTYDPEKTKQAQKEILPDKFKTLFQKKIIISHGRLEIEKGYEDLISVMPDLISQDPDARLVLLGNGSMKQRLKEHCNHLSINFLDWEENMSESLEEIVHFIPFYRNVFPFLKNASVFVLSSKHEGFGRSMLEAMVSKLPVVASDCPYAPREILVDRDRTYGYLLPSIQNSDNHSLYVKILLKTLAEDQTEIIEAAYKKAEAFDINKIHELWLKVINS